MRGRDILVAGVNGVTMPASGWMVHKAIRNEDEYNDLCLSLNRNENDASLSYCYRGQSDWNWELKPSIARKFGNRIRECAKYEENIFKELKKEFEKLKSTFSECERIVEKEILIIAQHYGLPTRLLDFSSDWRVAMFFATNERDTNDGSFFQLGTTVLSPDWEYQYSQPGPGFLKIEPTVEVFTPPNSLSQRIIAQKSKMVYVGDPTKPFGRIVNEIENNPHNSRIDFRNYLIDRSLKRIIQKRLQDDGITEEFLFVKLDDVCKRIIDK